MLLHGGNKRDNMSSMNTEKEIIQEALKSCTGRAKIACQDDCKKDCPALCYCWGSVDEETQVVDEDLDRLATWQKTEAEKEARGERYRRAKISPSSSRHFRSTEMDER